MTHHPRWIADKAATSRRQARPGTCPRCGAHTLTGPDNDTLAVTVTVNHHPITTLEEITEVLAGRPTVRAWHAGGGHVELTHREEPHIRHDPAQPGVVNIHARHHCIPQETEQPTLFGKDTP